MWKLKVRSGPHSTTWLGDGQEQNSASIVVNTDKTTRMKRQTRENKAMPERKAETRLQI